MPEIFFYEYPYKIYFWEKLTAFFHEELPKYFPYLKQCNIIQIIYQFVRSPDQVNVKNSNPVRNTFVWISHRWNQED